MKRFIFILFGLFAAIMMGAASLAYATTLKSAPLPPRNIQIQQRGNAALITWKKPLIKNFSGFRIYRSRQSEKLGNLIKKVNKNTFSFLDSNIQNDVTYFYTVRTVQKDGKKSKNKRQFSVKIQADKKLLLVTNNDPNICEELLKNGDPKTKINIVFIPDGDITFQNYKNFVDNFFTVSASYPNFMNRAPFKSNLDQFNFYNIWKEENYNCKGGNFDCEIKMRKLAELCPVTRTYDGITVVIPETQPVGFHGKNSTECKNTETKSKHSWTLSSREQYQINDCPGISRVATYIANQGYQGILHEWGHMIGNLAHPERQSIMSNNATLQTDYFDAADIAQICQKISEATGISNELCIQG